MAIVINGVKFVKAEDTRFTWEAYRQDCPDVVAWVSALPGDVVVHTAVSIERYDSLTEAAKAISKYK